MGSTQTTSSERHPIDRILDAVRSLRAGVGNGSLSYRRVARKAGLSSGTVSYYFASRASLLEAALDRHHERVAEVLTAWLQDNEPSPGAIARRLAEYSFANRGDVRLRLSTWVESWSLPPERMRTVDRWLTRLTGLPWMQDWSREERRVIVQGLIWATQRLAALSDDELTRIVGVDDPAEAKAIVVETCGKLADALADSRVSPEP